MIKKKKWVQFELIFYCDTFYPDEDAEAYDRWRDSKFESVFTAVLNGKSLTEALNEREDWDIQPEEQFSDAERAQFEYDLEQAQELKQRKEKFDAWREFAYRTIDELSAAYKTFCEDVLDNPLGVDFEDLISAQYGNRYAPKTVDRQFQTWLRRYKDFLIKYDPSKEED